VSLRVEVLTDPTSLSVAARIAATLKAAGLSVSEHQVDVFPKADPLPPLLLAAQARADRVVVAPSASTINRTWLVGELAQGLLYPRILLAVSTPAELPLWASATSPRIVVLGSPLPDLLRCLPAG